MFYTALHHDRNLPEGPIEAWSLKDRVDFFYTYIDLWHLEVADRCINGWKNSQGENYINGLHRDGSPATYIVDSGWAVLQITLNYFEVMGFFKLGVRSNSSYDLFKPGFYDVFPELSETSFDIAKIFWKGLRVLMYHDGNVEESYRGRILLSRSIEPKSIAYDLQREIVVINPHRFVPELRDHFKEYCIQIRTNEDSELANLFTSAFQQRFK